MDNATARPISWSIANLLPELCGDGVIVFDRAFFITACNVAALTLIRRPSSAVIGKPIDDVLTDIAWKEPFLQKRNHSFRDRKDATCGEFMDRGAGIETERWSVHPVLDEDGDVDGGFCIHHPAGACPGSDLLRHEVERLRDFVESASDWFWETDAELRYSYFSERYREATGVGPETRLGRYRGEFRLNGMENGDWCAHLADLAERRPFRDFVFAYMDANEQRRVAKVSGRPVFDEYGKFTGYRGVGRDITAEVAAEERILFLAQHDPLTGLPNRTVLKDRLEQLLQRASRYNEGLAVLCIDLDDFKDVNDTLGHAGGDILLCEVAKRMREDVRKMDTVVRLGGDEFTIVQVNSSRCEDAGGLAARLINSLSKPFDIYGELIYCGASVGISLYPENGKTADDLIRHADLALYKAKYSGRNTYRFFTAEMDREVQERRSLEKELRDALANEHFLLLFQPQVDIATGILVGCEALVRWQHPERGLINPGVFIQVAEKTGLIVSIDRWVLRNACVQAKIWKDHGQLTGRIAVNLSAAHIRRGDLVDFVLQILDETGLSPQDIEIEITESVLLIDTETVIATLTALSDLGISFSVDDFGTGYSSLTYLKRFPVGKVKIDQSFTRNLLLQGDDGAIARAIVSLGHSLGLTVVAEGVETEGQLNYLRNISCDHAQGYLIAKPLSAMDYESWMENILAPRTSSEQ